MNYKEEIDKLRSDKEFFLNKLDKISDRLKFLEDKNSFELDCEKANEFFKTHDFIGKVITICSDYDYYVMKLKSWEKLPREHSLFRHVRFHPEGDIIRIQWINMNLTRESPGTYFSIHINKLDDNNVYLGFPKDLIKRLKLYKNIDKELKTLNPKIKKVK